MEDSRFYRRGEGKGLIKSLRRRFSKGSSQRSRTKRSNSSSTTHAQQECHHEWTLAPSSSMDNKLTARCQNQENNNVKLNNEIKSKSFSENKDTNCIPSTVKSNASIVSSTTNHNSSIHFFADSDSDSEFLSLPTDYCDDRIYNDENIEQNNSSNVLSASPPSDSSVWTDSDFKEIHDSSSVATVPNGVISNQRYSVQNESRKKITEQFCNLACKGWYWGPLDLNEAEERLKDQPNGSFLVRDSSDDRHILSLSFRYGGKTLHTRLEYSAGKFSFFENNRNQSYDSVVELIEETVNRSRNEDVFYYPQRINQNIENYHPVRLNLPLSRFTQVRSLKYLCRFVIRQATRKDHIETLPVPNSVKGYLNRKYF